jgi:hypothetical protein
LKMDGLFCAQQLGKMSLPFGDRTAREKKRGLITQGGLTHRPTMGIDPDTN